MNPHLVSPNVARLARRLRSFIEWWLVQFVLIAVSPIVIAFLSAVVGIFSTAAADHLALVLSLVPVGAALHIVIGTALLHRNNVRIRQETQRLRAEAEAAADDVVEAELVELREVAA